MGIFGRRFNPCSLDEAVCCAISCGIKGVCGVSGDYIVVATIKILFTTSKGMISNTQAEVNRMTSGAILQSDHLNV